MPTQPPPIPGRSRPRNWLLVNLFMWPGLGSWLGGRRVTGAMQMSVSLFGATVATWWMIKLMFTLVHELQGARAEPAGPAQLAITGFGTLALAWLWSLVTSLALLREAKRKG